jgi:predicted adenine nucleotide alpha hydrolase (AANH) superfamily ATPase
MEVTGFFYNPNIHPLTEFRKRLITLQNYANIALLPLEVDTEYKLENFLKGTLERGEDRCLFCYETRLNRAFQKAVHERFDAVTTTLLYSKHQRHDNIREIGEKLADIYKVRFFYRDFRVGWKDGIEESKRINMYRQQYCGCIFSERDRYKEA